MKYYVIWTDGQKFGPADVDTLNQWIQEGRVTPTTELESVATMARLSAASVPGLVFDQPAPAVPDVSITADQPAPTLSADAGPSSFASPYGATVSPENQPANSPYQYPPDPTGNPYPRGSSGSQDGQTEAIVSIVLSVVGLCCCCLFPIAGLVLGYMSKNKGNQLGNTAVIIGWISVVLSIGGTIGWIAINGIQGFN